MALKYDLRFGVSEVARIFRVDRDTVKKWAYHFADYLKPGANPPKELPRVFCVDDLRVLAYVSMYWEDDPDYECIKIGLNTDSHFEEPFTNIVTELTPVFRELPEDIDETWRPRGSLVGGVAEITDTFVLAESYRLAGDILVNAASASDEVYEVIYPIIYNYRHATELYLKSIVPMRGHDLTHLLTKAKELLQTEFSTSTPLWFDNLALAFNDFDPKSDSFRYADGTYSNSDEFWFDIYHTKIVMGWLAEGIQNVKNRLP